jgi:hypothetical protein
MRFSDQYLLTGRIRERSQPWTRVTAVQRPELFGSERCTGERSCGPAVGLQQTQ